MIDTFAELRSALAKWDESVLLDQMFWMRVGDQVRIPLGLVMSEPFAQWKDHHFIVIGEGVVMPASKVFVLDRLEKLGLN